MALEKNKRLGKQSDPEFNYVLELDPSLEEWRILVAAWFKSQLRGLPARAAALDKFMLVYIHALNLARNPCTFLRSDHPKPLFGDQMGLDTAQNIKFNNIVHDFLAWILLEKLSVEDDNNNRVIPSEYHNPVPRCYNSGLGLSESNKTVLPYRYVHELREILVQGSNFQNWTWAHKVFPDIRGGNTGDWFMATPEIIDKFDPDCVWRTRTVDNRTVTELWSPARAIALLVKLYLPLRTFQVRMLDSGEADTYTYKSGQWNCNDSPLSIGSVRRPSMRGVFHRSVDLRTNQTLTGFYINTNKTADINKDEAEMGYIIPWQNEEVLYWLERLRNWQAKYNPIDKPIPWTELSRRHFGRIPPHESILSARGEACFLFRDPTARHAADRTKPISRTSLDLWWYRLLAELERRVGERGETLDDGNLIRFIDQNSSIATYFGLHSLRVSLITAYALDGGVPFPVLSKLIAGHARLIMTLYYTKAGKAHVSEIMQQAEKRLFESDKESYRRFLSQAAYDQINERFALNDASAALAASKAKSPAVFVFEDKGICPLGGGGCDIGGEVLRESSVDASMRVYAPVPGYPQQKNCVRCRFFMTGPAFMPGLIAHFNNISYQLSACSERYVRFEQQVQILIEERGVYQDQDRPFVKADELARVYRFYEDEAEKANKLAHDLHATLRLIDRCKDLLKTDEINDVKLVAAGDLNDVGYALAEVQSKLHQLEVICETAVIYPEIDAGKAVLERTQILDAMLDLNGRAPMLFKLTSDQQLRVGNHLMQLIQQRVGDLPRAVEVAEGKVLLRSLGLLDDALEVIYHDTGLLPVPMKQLISVTVE